MPLNTFNQLTKAELSFSNIVASSDVRFCKLGKQTVVCKSDYYSMSYIIGLLSN